MITQILGVALISLLTITPTLQQNNIEQLIAPNIEIQTSQFTSPDSRRLLVTTPFSYYHSLGNSNTYVGGNFKWNINQILQNGSTTDGTYSTNSLLNIYVNNNNFVFTMTEYATTGNVMREIIREYYNKSRGSYPTSESFSFALNNNYWETQNLSYTYTVNGNGGSMSGNIWLTNSGNLSNTVQKASSNITVPNNATLEQIIMQNIIPNPILSNNTRGNTMLYYWFDSALPQTTGVYNRILYGRNAYGQSLNFGNITINLTTPDTTPPTITSITGNSINWINQDITLTVQATDNVSLNSTAYSFDNGNTYQASNQLTFTTNQIVNVRVRDSSNNSVLQEVIINRIDKQSPAIVLAGNWKNTFELGELTSNNDLLNYLSISDGASGLNQGLTTLTNFNYNQAGTYTNVQVSATDNAGNNSVYTLPTVNIVQPADNTGPIITGPTTVNVVEGNITTQVILDLYLISDSSGVEPNTISIRDLNNNVITNWSPYTVGSYQLRVYARDTLNNITQYQFTLQVGEAPPPDLTPPTIVGPLLVSFEIGTYEYDSEILNLFTFSDNVAILQNQLIGEINYSELGEYQVIIRSTDTSNNVTNKNIVVRIRDTVVLGNYNPLTDLLSGIFGGALSMIFTIGTINILGLRLLDAMGVIILGTVLLFIYKAIKGGS
jgi:hypothetical protein